MWKVLTLFKNQCFLVKEGFICEHFDIAVIKALPLDYR